MSGKENDEKERKGFVRQLGRGIYRLEGARESQLLGVGHTRSKRRRDIHGLK